MKDVSEKSLPIVIASLTDSTVKQYDASLRSWWNFCEERGLIPYQPSVSAVLEFLATLLEKGSSYGTLNSYRSAISLISPFELGEDPRVKRFFKGVSKLKPPKPKYKFTWDLSKVLKALHTWYPNESLLDNLSIKLALLLALVTVQRVQTLNKISITNIIINSTEIQIRVPDSTRTSAPNRFQPLLSIPFFPNYPQVCVASTLKIYLDVTKSLRKNDVNQLFVTHRKPHHATCQTMSVKQ